MLETINQLFIQFTAFTKGNPVVAGVVSLWGLTVITFLFRNIPQRIWTFIKRQATTTLDLNSQDEIYFDFLEWVTTNKMHSFMRTLNLNNQRRGYGKSSLSVGYGNCFFFFKSHIFFMNRSEVEANQTEYTKERISISVVGRNQAIFKELFKVINKKNEEDKKYIKIYSWNTEYWSLLCRQFKRPLETVTLDKTAKEQLITHIETFARDKEWYRKNGIPYRTGILLQGPPGTGKTSLIKAICSKYNKKMYIINLNSTSDRGLERALANVPEGSIIVMEDIDGCSASLNRGKDIYEKPTKSFKEVLDVISGDEDDSPERSFLTISGVLNAIDGAASSEDRIIIATTNHPEKLDKALIREGRFDLKLTVDYMDNACLKEYMRRFYPDYKLPRGFQVVPNLAPCKLQKLVFDNKNDPKAVAKEVLQ